MSDHNFMEATYDKFIFKVSVGCLYHPGECWVREDGNLLLVGITDFQQKVIGDVAFIEAFEIGTKIKQGDNVGILETIKTTLTLISPVSAEIAEVNAELEENAQLINTDPFGEGWIYKIKPSSWESEKPGLMEAKTYFPKMEEKIDKEMQKQGE